MICLLYVYLADSQSKPNSYYPYCSFQCLMQHGECRYSLRTLKFRARFQVLDHADPLLGSRSQCFRLYEILKYGIRSGGLLMDSRVQARDLVKQNLTTPDRMTPSVYLEGRFYGTSTRTLSSTTLVELSQLPWLRELLSLLRSLYPNTLFTASLCLLFPLYLIMDVS